MFKLKKYNSTNFFKHTFAEFKQIDNFQFPENTNYKSKSNSKYFYTSEGVYRKSNHWGRVANCRWRIIANKNYKNQQEIIGFAKWTNFYPINSSEKIFYIKVDFENKTVLLQPNTNKLHKHLFTYSEAQKRIQHIQYLFKHKKWANYFHLEINQLRFKIINEFINTNKTLQKIKLDLK